MHLQDSAFMGNYHIVYYLRTNKGIADKNTFHAYFGSDRQTICEVILLLPVLYV